MELKINYQYTYFIHPFVVKENKYQKYILSLLKDKRFKLKILEKVKDFNLYKYFSPKTTDMLFSGFSYSKMKKLSEFSNDTKSALLSENPCTIFEYILKEDIQGKTEEKGIFFKVRKVEIICFNTGICFLVMKTNIEDIKNFSEVLNFNYKFRDIKQGDALKNYEKIYLQTNTFSNVNKLTEFINDITGTDIETKKLDIDTQRFLTYTYVCIDREYWNQNKSFEDIQYNFVKLANFLPADNSSNLETSQIETVSKWKYAKLGVTKQGIALFTSSVDINNFTDLPEKFEKEYLYTYILNLYKKIYLKKLEMEFKRCSKLKEIRKKFTKFTKDLWIQEITEDEIGSNVNYVISKALELDRLYDEVKIKYDVLYKELKIEQNTKAIIIVTGILIVSLVFNILNYIELIK